MSVCWDTIQKVAPSQCTPGGNRRRQVIRPDNISDHITLFSESEGGGEGGGEGRATDYSQDPLFEDTREEHEDGEP